MAEMHVLVVDDERDIQRLFEQRFRREIRSHELRFSYAFSAEEALEYLKTQDSMDLVLILSDINMPDMSGLELLRQIKEQRPDTSVYMITAYESEDKRIQAEALGASAFLSKPLDFDALRQLLLTPPPADETP